LKPFSLKEYQLLITKSETLEKDRHGVKVLLTPEGRIVKFFRQKRLISSARLKSYSSRFVDNALTLKRLGIKTVDVEGVYYCKPIKRTLVFYLPIIGQTLRTVLQDQKCCDDVMKSFATFFAKLHDKGVFFRSIHLNNVIVSDDLNSFGLIDMADMKVLQGQLSLRMRKRNFRHLTRYKVDQEAILSFGLSEFMDIYFSESDLPAAQKNELTVLLKNLTGAE
jgi:tRNA A-37 threonylcarbamoyl transferase component Bud32